MMQWKIQYRFPKPNVEMIADIVYPMQNPLYAVIANIKGIPIIVEPAIHIIKTIFRFSIIEIFVNFALSN